MWIRNAGEEPFAKLNDKRRQLDEQGDGCGSDMAFMIYKLDSAGLEIDR
ncbi:hypothetical protein [Mesorhizobium sp. B3-1-6]|nr:hypothetical protein [Mesorhizobium sp. B3-1-6]